jgi:hypothetical protein
MLQDRDPRRGSVSNSSRELVSKRSFLDVERRGYRGWRSDFPRRRSPRRYRDDPEITA